MTRRSLALALLLAACTDKDDGASAPVATLVPANGTHLFVTLPKAPSSILTGGTVDVVVAIARDGNDAYDGDVDLALAPADGFVAAPVTLDRIASSAKLTISVTPDHRHGDFPLRIVATSRDQKATGDIALPMLVRGKPGTLDTSFGTDGKLVLGEPNAEATGIAFQPDGKILLGGRIGSSPAVVRLSPEGRLDETFASGGKARIALAGLVSTHDTVVLPDGSIVLGGTGIVSGFLARLTKTGAPDPRFGSQGVILTPAQARGRMMMVSDGELYIGGQSSAPADKDAIHVLRLLPTGLPDPKWGTYGEAVLPFAPGACALGNGECFFSAMHPKPVGQLTICASRGDGVNLRGLFQGGIEDRNIDLTTPASVFSRCAGVINNTLDDFWAAGARDANTFQLLHFKKVLTGGPLVFDLQRPPAVIPAEAAIGGATAFAIGGPGKLVASADATPNGAPSQLAIVRVNAGTLQLDTSFGGKGYVMTTVGSAPVKTRALAVQPDGRIIVAGTNGDMVAVRYWP